MTIEQEVSYGLDYAFEFALTNPNRTPATALNAADLHSLRFWRILIWCLLCPSSWLHDCWVYLFDFHSCIHTGVGQHWDDTLPLRNALDTRQMCYCKPPFEAEGQWMRNQEDHQSKLPMDWTSFSSWGQTPLSKLGSSALLAPSKGKVDETIAILLPSIYENHWVVVYKVYTYIYMFLSSIWVQRCV